MVVIFLLLHGSASALGSIRGEAGLQVGALVLAACLFAQSALRRQPLATAVREIGLGRPVPRATWTAVATSVVLLLTIPAFAMATRSRMTMYPGWLALLPGLFAQGGMAEEVLFRGFLFGNLRPGRSFWRAAALSAGPFVAAHLILFATMDWPVALGATILALVVSFPLSYLYELGDRTIWAPALVHFVIQGAVKVVEIPGSTTAYPLAWLAASALIPWLAFVGHSDTIRRSPS